MAPGLILLVAALVVYVTPSVQGTAHLSFSNATVDITRAGCGASKVCVETPNDCDPAGESSCLFVSVVATPAVAPNGTMLSIKLRGDSSGYVALGLTANASEGTTKLFICAQNSATNGSFFFRTMQRNNTDAALTPTETIVNEIRGMVNGTMIKCEFNIPNVNAINLRTSHVTPFSILLGTGTSNGTALGPFNVTLNSGPVNFTNPAANPTAAPTGNAANTTAAPTGNVTMPNSSGAVQPHAVLLLLSVLSLPVMLRA